MHHSTDTHNLRETEVRRRADVRASSFSLHRWRGVNVSLSPTELEGTPRGTVGPDTRGTAYPSAAHLTSQSARPSLFRTCREQRANSPVLRRDIVIIEQLNDLIMIGLGLTRLNQISSTPTTRPSRQIAQSSTLPLPSCGAKHTARFLGKNRRTWRSRNLNRYAHSRCSARY